MQKIQNQFLGVSQKVSKFHKKTMPDSVSTPQITSRNNLTNSGTKILFFNC